MNSNYSKRQKYLPFTIYDAHGRARYLAAYAARGRRGVSDIMQAFMSLTINVRFGAKLIPK